MTSIKCLNKNIFTDKKFATLLFQHYASMISRILKLLPNNHRNTDEFDYKENISYELLIVRYCSNTITTVKDILFIFKHGTN